MEREDKIKWLWRYRNNMFLAESLWRQVEEWNAIIYEPSSRILDGLPKSASFSNNQDSLIVKHAELFNEAMIATEEVKAIRKETLDAIRKVDNFIGVKILTLRYVEGKEWHEIYHSLHYSKQHIHRIHNKALDSLVI